MKPQSLELPTELDIDTLALVFEHLPTPYILSSIERRILAVNKAAQSLFGYQQQELLGLSTKVLYVNEKEHELQGKKRFNPVLNYSNKSTIVSYQTKSGERFKGNTTGGPIKDEAGNILFYVASIHDD